MDRVYEFAVTPRNELGLEGVVFRFVPEPSQVDAALKVGVAMLAAGMHALRGRTNGCVAACVGQRWPAAVASAAFCIKIAARREGINVQALN